MLVNSGGSDYTQIISWSVSRVFRLWKGNYKFFLLFAFRNKFCMVLTWSPVCSCIEVGDLKRRYWLPYPMSVKVAGYWPSSLLLFLLCLYGPNDLRNFQPLKRKPVVGKSDGAFMHAVRLWRNFIAGTKRVIASGQYCSILPALVANPSAGFG